MHFLDISFTSDGKEASLYTLVQRSKSCCTLNDSLVGLCHGMPVKISFVTTEKRDKCELEAQFKECAILNERKGYVHRRTPSPFEACSRGGQGRQQDD